ncbi:hypothetical protein ACTWQF_36680 [Streptomyces sp. 8N114]|uniref:hypothetical protein n=1 Tax=Streptomyces sp. 8N114 TaxID=3457419 RepID=UPI003FD0D259
MNITTDYGSWVNHGDHLNVSVEATVLDAINGGDSEWQERMEIAGALDRIASDYRKAINEALPEGVHLVGNDFIGPYYEADHVWTGELDIAAVIEDVDLFAIIERHDVDHA